MDWNPRLGIVTGSHVNARASAFSTPLVQSGAIARAEHISIEAESDTPVSTRPPHRKSKAKYELASGLRHCSTELSLLEEHYLQVHARRRGREPQKYSIDLRFLNSQPSRVRHVAWMWWSLSVALLLSTGAAIWFALASNAMLSSPGLAIAGITAIAMIATTILGIRDTTESLNFTSTHGHAILVNVLGGIGSTQAGKTFFVAVIKEIAAAKVARAQPKQQLLRDEMREHHRLRELGVLNEAEYEASKARILKAHV